MIAFTNLFTVIQNLIETKLHIMYSNLFVQDWSDRRSQTLPNVFKRHKDNCTSPPKKPERPSKTTGPGGMNPGFLSSRSLTSLIFPNQEDSSLAAKEMSSLTRLGRTWTSVPDHLENTHNTDGLMVSQNFRSYLHHSGLQSEWSRALLVAVF